MYIMGGGFSPYGTYEFETLGALINWPILSEDAIKVKFYCLRTVEWPEFENCIKSFENNISVTFWQFFFVTYIFGIYS